MNRAGVLVDRVIAWAAAGLLVYWALYVAVAPVVTGDAHGYNLGRLLVAERRGLFDNPLWTNVNQIVFPWTFDAVHYPFLKLGHFENLPSFLCFAGLLAVVVLLLRRVGAASAWPIAALALLASPMLILQATTTKNDFPILFLAAAGAWFLIRWLEGDRRWFLPVMAALCGALALGTKSTGALLVVGISLGAVVAAVRCGWRGGVVYFAALPVFLLLFGSIETGVNNLRMYGDWRGEPGFIEWHKHSDGLRGGLANAVRYFFNGLSSGLDADWVRQPIGAQVWTACLFVLQSLGLDRVGFRKFEPPEGFYFMVSNVDSQSTFGLVGFVAAFASLALLVRFRFRAAWWWIALVGWAYFGAFCLKVGWGATNLRMLTPAYGLWIVAVIVAVAPWLCAHPGWRRATAIVLFAAAMAVPAFASKRSPRAIVDAVRDREAMMLAERPDLREELALADRVRREHPGLPTFVVLGAGDWVVPYLLGAHGDWRLVPNPNGLATIDPATLRRFHPDIPAGDILLLLSQARKVDFLGHAQELGATPGGGVALKVSMPPAVR
jgi:hypothetical protein